MCDQVVFVFVREGSQLSYFLLGLLLCVVASNHPSHVHVMPRLISIEVIWKHHLGKNFTVLNYSCSSVSLLWFAFWKVTYTFEKSWISVSGTCGASSWLSRVKRLH